MEKQTDKKLLSYEIKNNWSKYGDLSDYTRKELIRKVIKLEKSMIKIEDVEKMVDERFSKLFSKTPLEIVTAFDIGYVRGIKDFKFGLLQSLKELGEKLI